MTTAARLASLVLSLLVLTGCVVANAIVEPYHDLHIRAAINSNPDDQGQPSPLVVRVYELHAKDAFEGAGFFDLYDNAEATLGDDLVRETEMVIRPARELTHDMRLDRDTRYIGIIGAFRDIDNANWKLSLKADPRDYESRYIKIDRRTISLDDRH